MRHNVHSYTRAAETPATRVSEASLYPDELLPELQSTLAALATLEIRHEIELDYLEDWPGPGEVKQSLRAERERAYQQARIAHFQQLARLQERVKAIRSTH